MVDIHKVYDPTLDIWPDLEFGRKVLAPVRVGVDRQTGRMIVGWDHVEQSIGTILATRYHERVLRRWVGSFVPHLLGELATIRVITRFYWAIFSALDLWEPNYRVNQVAVDTRKDGSRMTSAEELRSGGLTTRLFGVYRPRAHLGDETTEVRRSLGLIGRGYGVWERAPET